MTRKLYLILFSAILLLGILLRFYDLGKVPDSLNWDEVSWGYNAYSILTTARDEHGELLPLSFKAFGDYKQPVYVYLTSLSIGVFGLNDFAVRFPSAFLGSITILFVWLLIYSLFYKEKYKNNLALLGMLLFSISPWSIQFSRVAFEANVGIFFVIAGVALFLLGLNKQKVYLTLIGVALLSISCYSYHSNKIFTPILFGFLLVYAKIQNNLTKKTLTIFLLVFIILNFFWLFDARTTARGRSVTFVSNQTSILKNSAEQLIYDNDKNDLLGSMFHNRRIVYANYYFENYLKHFDPNFLFIEGDNARHHPFGMGIIYLVSIPLLIFGFVRLDLKKYWIVIVWLLLAPVASALAVDAPNASRSLVFLPTWQILEAIGLLYILSLKKANLRLAAVSIFAVILSLNFVYFVHNYFSHTNSEYGIYWQSGYKEVVTSAKEISKGNPVFISNEYEQPYIFYLFHNRVEPMNYLRSGGSSVIAQECYSIENVYFGNCDNIKGEDDFLISPDQLADEKYQRIDEIYSIEGNLAGYVYRHR